MKSSLILFSCQIDQKKSESADYENEIAYAQQQATEYANLLAEQTAEIQQLEAERIAAEEEPDVRQRKKLQDRRQKKLLQQRKQQTQKM